MNNLLTIAMFGTLQNSERRLRLYASLYNATSQHTMNTPDLTVVDNKGNKTYIEIKSFRKSKNNMLYGKSKNNMHNYTKAYYNKDMSHYKRSKKGNH